MTTTPLPPLPDLRGGIVKHTILGELYDRLQVEQRMVAYATQARADLEAENARLREALEQTIGPLMLYQAYGWPDRTGVIEAARSALETKK